MPVKRTKPKARRDPEAEAAFWAEFWDAGGFLLAGWAERLGLGPVMPGKEWQDAERRPVVMEAARDAWARLGRDYLAGRLGRAHRADDPERGAWALEQFGEPGHAS